jgi:hypothetical protein
MLLSKPCFFANESANAYAVSPSHTTILSDLLGPKFTSTYNNVYFSDGLDILSFNIFLKSSYDVLTSYVILLFYLIS